jgi:hypothetical protein
LHVFPLDKRRHRRAVGGREVARCRLERGRRDDEAPERERAGKPGRRDRGEDDPARDVGAHHQPLPAPAVCSDPAVQAEDERRDAVGQTHRDDAERPAGVEREPHQCDVVERVAELAGRNREIEPPEVGPPE